MLTIILIIFLYIAYFLFGISSINRVQSKNGLYYHSKSEILPLYFFGFLMVIIATFRPENMPDFSIYLYDFYTQSQKNEIGYNFIDSFVFYHFSKEFRVLLFIMALLSIPIKIVAITKMSKYIWLSMAIYLSSKFILQDMIQMRAAVSTGIFLFCCKYKFEKKTLKYFSGIVIALMFHWSALLMIPVWFLNEKNLNKEFYIISLLGSFSLAYVGMFATKFISYIPIAEIQQIYAGYSLTNDLQSSFNLFSIVILSKVLLCIFMLCLSKRITIKDIKYVYFIKIYTISLIIYALLGDITVAAVRLSEFYQIIEIILIPMICYIFKDKDVGKIIVFSIAGIYIWFNFCVTKYIPI